VLADHRDLLESIAQALLERETLDRTEIESLERGETLPPPARPEEPVGKEPEAPRIAPAQEKSPRAFGLGGEGPLPGPAPGVTEAVDDELLP